jgi:RND family efflux transporter MFP subunit
VAEQQSDVTGVVPGRVVEVLVRRGDVVAEGAPLVRLRDVDYRLQAAAARAALEQAQARLGMDGTGRVPRPEDTAEVRAAAASRDLAEDGLRRAERLAESGALAQAELDRARAQAAAARAQYDQALNGMRSASAALAQARVAIGQASTAVRESIVRAPFAGEIAEVFVDPGEYVAPQMRVVSLVSTHPLRLEMPVPQEQLAAVARGQAVQVRVPAFPERVFAGVVRRISAAVRADTRALTVEAEVPNEDGALRPGMFARARVELGTTTEGARVPANALLSEAGSHRVFVIGEGSVIEERVVTLAERDGETAVLSGGLRAGERVATSRLDRLTDGVRVAVVADGAR